MRVIQMKKQVPGRDVSYWLKVTKSAGKGHLEAVDTLRKTGLWIAKVGSVFKKNGVYVESCAD